MSLSYNEITRLLPTFLLCSQSYSVVVTDLEGKYIFVNDLFKKRFSFITTDFIGLPFQHTVHEEDIEKCNEAAYYCITHPEEIVSLMVRKPENEFGEFYWTSWEFSLSKDQNGQAVGILCIGHDVTSEKAAQQKLELSQRILSAIYNSAIDAKTLISSEYKIIYFNKIAAELAKGLFGKYPQVGENYLDYILPHLQEKVKSKLDRALLGEVIRDEQTDGKKWYQFTNFPVYDENNKLVGIAINIRDISELKATQLTLKESEQRLEILASNFPDGSISLIDKNLKCLYTGGAGYKNYEVNPLVFIGKSIYEMLPVEIYTQIVELLPSLLEGHYHSFEAMFHGKVFLNTLQPIANEEGQVESFVLASIDITDRKENEEKIKERNSLLEEIAWLQSHEMRRPVANILGLMHLIKMEEQDEDRKIMLYLDHLEKATEHLDQVIHKVVAKVNDVF